MIRTAAPKPDLLLGWMGSLADTTRLRLLRLLDQHELGVAELCEILQLPQSTVSRHLKVLAEEGWLQSRRQGTGHLYRVPANASDLEPAARKLWVVAREQVEAWPAARQDQVRLAGQLRERRRRSEAFFAGAAGEWDKLREEFYGRSLDATAMCALLPEDAVVADLGCGAGSLAVRLAPWVGRVIGVDSSPAMLKAARARSQDLPNVELRRGDLSAVPIDDASCDAAMLLLVLSYLPEQLPALAEMARILKPGGRAAIIDLLGHDREDFRLRMGQQVAGFELDQVKSMLDEVGLAVTRTRPLPPEAGARGPAMFLASAVRPTRAS